MSAVIMSPMIYSCCRGTLMMAVLFRLLSMKQAIKFFKNSFCIVPWGSYLVYILSPGLIV